MIELARTLIALGVPLEARDNLGWTALMGCDSPELAQLLLSHGANPNARAKDGTTPVLATDDDRVAVILLRAGADPLARNDQGSVRSNALKSAWPATIAWLDQHGVH
jgi:ankyrin repeat protein